MFFLKSNAFWSNWFSMIRKNIWFIGKRSDSYESDVGKAVKFNAFLKNSSFLNVFVVYKPIKSAIKLSLEPYKIQCHNV